MFIFPGTSSQNGFFHRCCHQKWAWIHIQIHIHMHIHIQIHIPYMGLGTARRAAAMHMYMCLYILSPCSFLMATSAKESILGTCSRKNEHGHLGIRSKQAFFSKWLPRPNHYAHSNRIEILSKTPVSTLRDLPPRPQNLRETSNNSFLAWMSTLISKWRRRFPNNSGHLPEPWSNVRRNQISRSGNPSLRL